MDGRRLAAIPGTFETPDRRRRDRYHCRRGGSAEGATDRAPGFGRRVGGRFRIPGSVADYSSAKRTGHQKCGSMRGRKTCDQGLQHHKPDRDRNERAPALAQQGEDSYRHEYLSRSILA